MKAAVCTIVAKNYLAQARVLMESVRVVDPDLLRIVILVDRIDGYFDPAKESFDVILSEDLGIPRSRWFHFKYPVLELSTAVKPYALEHLFRQYQLDKLIYLDPDIQVYASLQPLLAALDGYSIVLTPHLLDPLDDGFHPAELDILRCGVYNLGFIGLSARPETHRFLEWWCKKLYDLCLVDLPRGIFVDQGWMDLAPGLFSQVGIIRDPGYNVAYWNLSSRKIERIDDSYTVNGQPLYFFHFSGFDPKNPGEFSRHQNRFRFSSLGLATQDLALQYRDNVLAAGFEECRKWPYAYGRFANGLPIADKSRLLHHDSQKAQTQLEDPFSEEGFWAFVDTGDQPNTKNVARKKKPTDPVWIKAESERPETLNELIAGNGGLKLTRLAQIIYDSRPELRESFPDPCGRDSVRFLTWILTYGKSEHRLTRPNLEPLRSQWGAILGTLEKPSDRLRHQFLLAGMSASVAVRRLGSAVTHGVGRTIKGLNTTVSSGIGLVQAGIRSSTGSLDEERRLPGGGSPLQVVGPMGLNLVGYVRSEMGVGESSRAAARAAKTVGLPVALRDIPTGDYRSEDHSAGPTANDFPYAFNVFHVNADQSRAVVGSLDPAFSSSKYNIGFWHWELDQFPDRWMSAFDPYQEIWTSSTFCQEAIARKSPVPVVQIPHSINFQPPPRMGRAYFGLPPGRFLFLTLFDMLSVFDRKNPLGAVEAFIKAFGNDPSVQLIVKINNAQRRPEHLKTLTDQIAGYPISIIDCTYTRDETYALMHACDCVISLHRSEGFGLTLAEAMYLGKPVIATAYSGNMDFTRFDNSFLVGYRLKSVGKNNDPYDPDASWADPLIDHAAQQMRIVTSDRQAAQNVAVAGQEFVRRQLSPAAVGRLMWDRLHTVYQSGHRGWPRSGASTERIPRRQIDSQK